jgi:alpha-tubulin suppressor-like RCC1 family protein
LPPAALPPGLTLLFAGNNQACAGMGLNLWCWGENIWGTIGVPSEPGAALTPAALSPFPASLDGMAGRNRHVCARQTDQEAYCWGVGYGGELGDGTNGEASSPSLVLF